MTQNNGAADRGTGPMGPSGRLGVARRPRRGSILIEQALLLALIGGGALMAADAVGAAVFGVFSQTAVVATTANQSEVASGDTKSASVEADQSTAAVTAFAEAETRVFKYRVIAVGGVLVLGIGVWCLLYREDHKKKPSEIEQLDAQEDEYCHKPGMYAKRQQILRILAGEADSLLANQVTVRQLMSTKVKKVTPDTPADQIREEMMRAGSRHLVVCDVNNRLLGVISDRDLSRSGKLASDLMTADPETVDPDSSISPAVTTMLHHRISCLPVVTGDKVSGMLTTTDLVMALQCVLQVMERIGADAADSDANEAVADGENREELLATV